MSDFEDCRKEHASCSFIPPFYSRTFSFDSFQESKDKPTNVDIYTVEFEKSKQKGFSIATDDDRIENNVFFYTENGSVRDTSFNEGIGLMAI